MLRKRLIRGWMSLIPLALATYIILHVYQGMQVDIPTLMPESSLMKSRLNKADKVSFLRSNGVNEPFQGRVLKEMQEYIPSVDNAVQASISGLYDFPSAISSQANTLNLGNSIEGPINSAHDNSLLHSTENRSGKNSVELNWDSFKKTKKYHIVNGMDKTFELNGNKHSFSEDVFKPSIDNDVQQPPPRLEDIPTTQPLLLMDSFARESPKTSLTSSAIVQKQAVPAYSVPEIHESSLTSRNASYNLTNASKTSYFDSGQHKAIEERIHMNSEHHNSTSHLPAQMFQSSKLTNKLQDFHQNEIIVHPKIFNEKGQPHANGSSISNQLSESSKPAASPSESLPNQILKAKSYNLTKKPLLPIDYLKGNILVKDRYDPGFTTAHEDLCPNGGSGMKLFVFVTSAPDHERQRRAIRLTWGAFAVRKDISLAFVVGRTMNSDIQSNIDKENEVYSDIIVAKFIDHYSNLTLKTMSIFDWIQHHCTDVRFILKTDDDMFINIPLLLALVDTRKRDHRTIYGRYARNWGPVRNKKSKYYIDSKTYNKTKYPSFLTGPAYLFTNDVVDDLFSVTMSAPFFTLEDVLVTGFVAESLGLKRIGVSHFKNEHMKLTDVCKLKRAISIHMVKYDEQFDIHKKILDGKTKCKTR